MTNRPSRWSNEEFQSRYRLLISEGFIPEEAWELAHWNQPLDHWVLRNMRADRQRLVKNLSNQGLEPAEIANELHDRYMDLGLRGQFEEEDWYFERKGAP